MNSQTYYQRTILLTLSIRFGANLESTQFNDINIHHNEKISWQYQVYHDYQKTENPGYDTKWKYNLDITAKYVPKEVHYISDSY